MFIFDVKLHHSGRRSSDNCECDERINTSKWSFKILSVFVCVCVCVPTTLHCFLLINAIITGRNEVVAKVIFLHLSVILFTEGCLPQCMLGYHTPRSRHPPEADTPWSRHPHRADPLRRQKTPWSRHPPRADTPQSRHPPGSGLRHLSGRYASYWNAFLFWSATWSRVWLQLTSSTRSRCKKRSNTSKHFDIILNLCKI